MTVISKYYKSYDIKTVNRRLMGLGANPFL